MKKIFLLVAAILVSSSSLADTAFSKNSPQLNSLGSAWKSHHSMQLNQNDITIVYGGEDVSSHRPTLVEHTAIA